ncbi:MAG: dihydrofolate reductase [Clostridiales bacterium]|nr:dihydrofolate reductase [Clostridiales bacterium]
MNMIVAVDKNWGIGAKNNMPWYIPEDMKFFKNMTINKTVVMGRITFLSFPKQLPLKNRHNIILTRDENFKVNGATTVNGVLTLIELVKELPSEDVFIIGGQSIYQTFEKYCKKAYITKIDNTYKVDTYFPNLDLLDHWKIDKIHDTKFTNDGTPFTVYEYINTQI